MLVRHARRSMSVLLAAGLALLLSAGLTACTGEPEERPPAPATATPSPAAAGTPSPTASPTARPTPSPTPPQTPSPTPTATPLPTPTASPTPVAAPSPTPTATPSPTPTATPAPLITAEDLGIREVDTAEALAAAGLTHARYAAGEEVPWDPGLFLLDVGSGEVEGWVRSLAALSEEERGTARRASDDIAVSPSNRFRLASSGAFVAMDAGMQPVARFTLPPGERFTSPNGGYILVRECVGCEPGDRFHLVNLEDEANPEVHSWVLPWKTRRYKSGDLPYRIELLDDLVAFIADTGDATCRVVRYDLRGTLLSDHTIPRGCYAPGSLGTFLSPLHSLHRISPDGRLLATATSSGTPVARVFNAATGEEIMRVLGVYLPWSEREPTAVWLADGSGVVVRTHRGQYVVTLDGAWERAPGRPAPDDPDRFFSYYPLQVLNQAGAVTASFSLGGPSAPIPDPSYEAFLILDELV